MWGSFYAITVQPGRGVLCGLIEIRVHGSQLTNRIMDPCKSFSEAIIPIHIVSYREMFCKYVHYNE